MNLRQIFEHCQRLMDQNNRGEVADFLLHDCRARYIGSGCYSRAYCLEYRGTKYVLKFSRTPFNYPEQAHLNANSELKKRWLKPIYRSKNVVVQPLVKTWEEEDDGYADKLADCVYEKIMKKANEDDETDCLDYDIHGGNIGLYKRRVVVFDC